MASILSEIKKFTSECWKTILADVYDAAVYIDHSAIECLHWYTSATGYLTFKDAGAVAVHEIDMYNFCYAEVKDTKKAVIVSTSNDPTFYRRTLKMILSKNAFESCTIYCGTPCCTTSCRGTLSSEEELDYGKLKEDVTAWMSYEKLSQKLTVDVVYVPIFVAPVNSNVFVTPPFADLMPPLDKNISKEVLAKVDLLAYSFCQLFRRTKAKLDVYSMGNVSEQLASRLEDYIANSNNYESEALQTGVSLILVDRTLDLGAPTSSGMESFLTKILRTFPRLPHHDNDVAIDMSPIFGDVTNALELYNVPGSLAGIDEVTMNVLVSHKERQLLGAANQFLHDMALTKDSQKLRTPTRVSGHSLEKALNKIQNDNAVDPMAIHAKKLQAILAITKASTSRKASQLELLTGLEKLLLQSLSVSRESSSVLTQLSKIIRTRNRRGLDTENLLALSIHIYAVTGTQFRFWPEQERQLQESIADAIVEDFQAMTDNPLVNVESAYWRTLSLLRMNDIEAARETSYGVAARIIDTLRSVAEQRSALQDYRFCMLKPTSDEQIRYIGILEQLTKDLFSENATQDMRDLHAKLPSLLSTGFNLLLGGTRKRHPNDNPLIVIYIIGGITVEEVKVAQEVTPLCSDGKTSRVMLSGSRLLNPIDIVNKILFS